MFKIIAGDYHSNQNISVERGKELIWLNKQHKGGIGEKIGGWKVD